MTKAEAITQQRRHRRLGYYTWITSDVISGEEQLGLQYTVWLLGPDGRPHTLRTPYDRVGGTRTTII